MSIASIVTFTELFHFRQLLTANVVVKIGRNLHIKTNFCPNTKANHIDFNVALNLTRDRSLT